MTLAQTNFQLNYINKHPKNVIEFYKQIKQPSLSGIFNSVNFIRHFL